MAWSVTAATDLPLDKSESWDGGAAAASIFTWAGGTDFDPAKAKRGFCFQDGADPTKRGSYKDPFAHVVDGTLKAVKGGVDAAVQRIPQTNGPSAEQKATAVSRMKSYQTKFGEGADATEENTPESEATPERGLFVSSMSVRMMPQSEDLIALAKSRAMDPTVFDEGGPPYLWNAQASNQRLDTYGTKMHETSLKNYAADAADGVSFQNSHNTRELGFGRSIAGSYHDGRSAGGKSMEATFFTIPDLNLNGVNTDQLIRGMRAGIVKDVSIGFYGGSMDCSICGRSIWDWECEHIAFLYGGNSVDESTGEPAFVWVRDAHLAEVSAVYDGATPGAGIMKAQREAEIGRIRPEAVRFLEARFRVRLPAGPPHGYAGIDIPRIGGNSMGTASETVASAEPTVEEPRPDELAVETIRQAIREVGGDRTLDPAAAIRLLGDELTRLRPLADDGRAYRNDLIDEAIAQGIRAHGNDFKQEVYRAVMEGSSIDVIKQMRDDWRAGGDGFFQANGTQLGGRQTDLREDERPKPTKRELPESAFRV